MTGCVALRKDVYYVRLTYYDSHQKRNEKWVSTGLSGRGAKQKSTAMIQSMIDKSSYLEKSDHPSKMADYLKMWKELQIGEVAETTYDGYHTYIDRHTLSRSFLGRVTQFVTQTGGKHFLESKIAY